MMGRGFGGGGAYGGRMAGGQIGGPGAFFPFGGILFFLVSIAIVALLVFVFWRIFDRAGLPGALGLLMLVPVVNVGAVIYLAFAEWPALAGPAAVMGAPGTPAPAGVPSAVPVAVAAGSAGEAPPEGLTAG